MELPTTIRASQVGAMLGVSRRQSPLALFHKLRGDIPEPEDQELFLEGREFEDAIARIVAKKYDIGVDLGSKQRITHGVFTGEIDRTFFTAKECGVLEIKNTMFFDVGDAGWGDPGTDVVPSDYWFQTHTYLHLVKVARPADWYPSLATADYAHLGARLYGGTKLYTIRYDAEVMRKVESDAHEFLARVRENNPPSPRDEADMRMRWLVQKGKRVTATSEIAAHIKALADLSKQIRDAEKVAGEIKTVLLGFAQDADAIIDENGDTLATLGSNRMFDEAAFIADNPQIAPLCMKLSKEAVKKNAGQKTYDRYMRPPQSALEQTRTIRPKGSKEE